MTIQSFCAFVLSLIIDEWLKFDMARRNVYSRSKASIGEMDKIFDLLMSDLSNWVYYMSVLF